MGINLPQGSGKKRNKMISTTTYPKDHWTLKTGYFEDIIPAIQVRSPFHWRVLADP